MKEYKIEIKLGEEINKAREFPCVFLEFLKTGEKTLFNLSIEGALEIVRESGPTDKIAGAMTIYSIITHNTTLFFTMAVAGPFGLLSQETFKVEYN